MRHLSVPKSSTEAWLRTLRQHGWLVDGAGVLAEGDARLLPLTDGAPSVDDEVWQGLAVVERDERTRGPAHWMERLGPSFPADLFDDLPSSHEVMGDVLLVKLGEDLEPYSVQVANAMLEQFPHVRVVCEDRGVHGTFRVRNLRSTLARG
jgi:tRNA (guanine37-N1)-methyltransferase